MPTLYNDRVKESCSAPGTSAITLLGAATGFQSFSNQFPNPSAVAYVISATGSALWEVGIGTFTTTLSRDRVINGSSGPNTLVNFATGSFDVYCSLPAENTADLALTMGVRMGMGLGQ